MCLLISALTKKAEVNVSNERIPKDDSSKNGNIRTNSN